MSSTRTTGICSACAVGSTCPPTFGPVAATYSTQPLCCLPNHAQLRPQAAAQGNTHAMELLAGALALDIRLHAQASGLCLCAVRCALRAPTCCVQELALSVAVLVMPSTSPSSF